MIEQLSNMSSNRRVTPNLHHALSHWCPRWDSNPHARRRGILNLEKSQGKQRHVTTQFEWLREIKINSSEVVNQ